MKRKHWILIGVGLAALAAGLLLGGRVAQAAERAPASGGGRPLSETDSEA